MVMPPRTNAVAILLPTGDVFVSGGLNVWNNTPPGPNYDATFAVLAPEIYNTAAGTWTALTDTPGALSRALSASQTTRG
jgi:hypothetical protein